MAYEADHDGAATPRYAEWVGDTAFVRESAPWPEGLPRWTERHLQCVWYDERLRPSGLRTSQGEAVEVVQPGRWNLEAGPDFLGAELRVGPSRRALRGDVEIHVRPADWTQHRHGADPRYAGVVLHVTYFPGLEQDPRIPAHLLRVSLQEGLVARRGFSFEDIDVAAYPHAVIPSTPRPCGEVLGSLAPDRWGALLRSAGHHRLRSRARRMAARLREVGDRRQVFYEETLAILGAKRNSTPFRKVAERFPLAEWGRDDPVETHYARLLGTAGLLPDVGGLRTDAARQFARELWDAWFRSGGSGDTAAGEVAWTFAGLRPLNHPVRRLAAVACLFGAGGRIVDELLAGPTPDPGAWVRMALRKLSDVPPMPYWSARQGLDSTPAKGPVALLGTNRAAAILTNVVVPIRMAGDPAAEALVDALPEEDLGAPAREAAFRLFGRDHNPAFYARSGVLQQGLLAIHHDFCLRTRGGCEACPLADHLREVWGHVR